MHLKLDERLEYIASEIVDACYAVHKELGPGLLEDIYEVCLKSELTSRKIKCDSQLEISVFYKGRNTGKCLKVDILVEDSIILELKSVESLLPVHKAQLITYLKLMDKRLGFLVNFNVPVIKNGIKRMII